MTPRVKRSIGTATVIGLAVIVIFSVKLGTADDTTHADGAGPLASLNEPGGGSFAVNPRLSPATSWTWGLRLCIASGNDLPVLDSIAAKRGVGTGYEFLGAKVREFSPTSTNAGIIAVENYPPPHDEVPDELQGIQGFTVTTPCSLDPRARYTELLIGMAKIGGDGGGWRGVEVRYMVGGRKRVLDINYGVLICGPSVAQCSPPVASP